MRFDRREAEGKYQFEQIISLMDIGQRLPDTV